MHKTLRDGLILRSISEGYTTDRDGLPGFFKEVFGQTGNPDADWLRQWTETLLAGDHPTVTGDDVWVVVDPAENDRIVSGLLLIPQTWRYENILLPVGRPELVATHTDYRRRGLIRELMNAAHERSAALGHVIQGITGIPHYYRQFGYTMALDLGGHAFLPLSAVRDLPEGESPRYTLRPATDSDIPNIMMWNDYMSREYAVSVARSAEEWRYELHGRDNNPLWKLDIFIISRQDDGTEVGYVAVRHQKFDISWVCMDYAVGEQSSYLDTFEDVIRGLKGAAHGFYTEEAPTMLIFDSGPPAVLDLLIDRTFPGMVRERHYAWYIRAASPARLIREITPVLERRLVGSGANCYTGDLKIQFYDLTGLHIRFEHGQIVEAIDLCMDTLDVAAWEKDIDAGFPWHSFLTLVFGYRTYDELQHILPDCWANRKATVLFDALFPRKRSSIRPLA
ncbi:MAG: GNAT family N-acetyltransferase [Anaerolineaceae bacterium]|nr:GNAT family N-acetyltransferase [Anaerolineaceae bacterium]